MLDVFSTNNLAIAIEHDLLSPMRISQRPLSEFNYNFSVRNIAPARAGLKKRRVSSVPIVYRALTNPEELCQLFVGQSQQS